MVALLVGAWPSRVMKNVREDAVGVEWSRGQD
jgi:hypothetical protein